MKLDPEIHCDDGTILSEISPCDGGVYLIFRVPSVVRGMHGKSKGHVDEVLIVGVPWSKADKFLSKYGFRVEKFNYD